MELKVFETRSKLKVVESHDAGIFERECNALMNNGYIIHSSKCGVIDSEEYNYCSWYQAIFVKED